MPDPNETLQELRKISKILMLANMELLEKELSKIATTDDRKRIWVLIDGVRTPKQISEKISISERSVQLFIAQASASDFVDTQRGKPPKKILDFVPLSWLSLVSLEESNSNTNSPQSGEDKHD